MNGWNQKTFMRHWRKKQIKTVYLLLLTAVFAGLSIYYLRQNNLKMVSLRSAVVAADTNKGDVAGSIERLNHHVFHHMNTQIVRPVELVTTYNLQAQAVIEAASKTSGRDVYAEGTAQCERRGIPLASIAQCISDYALNNNPGDQITRIVLPDKNRFIYTFASPRWTPDAAGFSLVLTVVFGIWSLIRLIEFIIVRLIVRRRLKNEF